MYINSFTTPQSKLHKRHNALSCHRTREAVAADWLRCYHVPGKLNPADILSKHWDHPSVWDFSLRPILFWEGNTLLCLLGDGEEFKVPPLDDEEGSEDGL